MFPRNGSVAGGPAGGRNISKPTSIRPKKKPAPPRPPQPSINRLQSSQSFNTAQDLGSAKIEMGGTRPAGKDLIDFITPPGSPASNRRNTVANLSNALNEPKEFSYRVGASIFYVKSQLKNSASETPTQNPFSPPRPSAGAAQSHIHHHPPKSAAAGQLQSNINSAWSNPHQPQPSSNPLTAWDTPPVAMSHPPAPTNNNVPPKSSYGSVGNSNVSSVINSQLQRTSSPVNNNTIKSTYENQSAWIPATVSSSSNSSSNRSTALSDFGGQPRYSNIPAESGKKELTATFSTGSNSGASKPRGPTIIRPATKVTSQLSKSDSVASSGTVSALQKQFEKSGVLTGGGRLQSNNPTQRNYYDEPPDEFDDDDDDDDEPTDSSFASPPMPSEPPPPPPVDLAVDEWVSSTTGVVDYPDTYSDFGQVTAYAIALYDFTPEAEGDLRLQVGDLVYLIRQIDDSWFYGSCDGMEGMFPTNFVNVVVPLSNGPIAIGQQSSGKETSVYANVLYDFTAETEGDISLQVGEKVQVLGRINEDWLYGEKEGIKGQFPAAFVDQITTDLPIITI